MVTRLQAADAKGLITWDVHVDSTVCGAHQHAAGASRRALQKEPPGGLKTEPADHALGRSWGGLSTKIHLAWEQRQRPLSLLIKPGPWGDSPQFRAVLAAIRVPRLGRGRPHVRPDRVRADRAHSSRANRAHLRGRGIKRPFPSLLPKLATGGGAASPVAGRHASITKICRAASTRRRPPALDCATAASTGCPSTRTRSNGVWPVASALTATGTVGSTSASTPARCDGSDSIPTSPPPRSPAHLHLAGGMPPQNATLTRGCLADKTPPGADCRTTVRECGRGPRREAESPYGHVDR
ncbi:transposase [Streptomyces sp. ISL-99]|nr:transposase [Streptomyces sp. ISL-99]